MDETLDAEEKVREGLAHSEDLILRTTLALEVADIDAAETLFTELKALTLDLELLTAPLVVETLPEPQVVDDGEETPVATTTEPVSTTTDPGTGTSTPEI